jgi:glycine/D-amino acid oxidase-like deaminating enzyme/nitrite reductase/ring-hydroxylating ferredoxin subunit
MADRGDLPGRPASVWLATTPETDYDPLHGDASAETVVIGGGIAGLTTATLLAEAGRDVALLERDRIGVGVTGHTTAKVTSQHGLRYAGLIEKHGRETARKYAEANQAAVEFVAERVVEHGVDCNFDRLPAYTFTESAGEVGEVREEVRAARALDLPASFVEDISVADAAGAVRFDDQAAFDPRRYLLALAESFVDAGGRIFEETRATGVDGGSPCQVKTERETVTGREIVVATHFPILDRAGYFARQYPKRSYVLAANVANPPTDGMYYRSGTPYFSARAAEIDGETLALVGGQNHKTGQGGSTAERYRRLEEVAHKHFDVESVEYRWSTQDYVSVDKIPYIGRLGPFERNVYVATGFGGWGMSNGTAAGMALADAIRGQPNQWLDTFDPLRTTVRASAREFAEENVNVANRFASDWVEGLLTSELRDLGRDEATVCRREGNVLGVYRDGSGTLHAVDAVCPHLGCLVQWNDGERTWDCPCHGSRFELDGRVINGPANEDLSEEAEHARR